jgi:nicotinate-nucleotide pyrophosphorylase (carboxylating)
LAIAKTKATLKKTKDLKIIVEARDLEEVKEIVALRSVPDTIR